LQWPLTELIKQTRQAVHTFKQSVLLRCLFADALVSPQNLFVTTSVTLSAHLLHLPNGWVANEVYVCVKCVLITSAELQEIYVSGLLYYLFLVWVAEFP
jgi:hypothetical protein